MGPKALPGSGSLIEGDHLLHDKGQTVFDRKVTRVQPMHLRMGKILEIGLTPLAREEDVILSPENDCLGLLLSEERLPLRVEFHVCPVVIEKIELDLSSVRSIKVMQIHVPVVGANELRSGMAVGVDQLDSVGLQECFKRFLALGRPRFPIGAAQAVPRGGEADFVRVGVLYDQPFQPVRTPCDDTETHGSSVVLSVQSEASKTDSSEKQLDDL